MRRVYFASDQMITSLGFSTEENIIQVRNNISGIKTCTDPSISNYPAAFSAVDTRRLDDEYYSAAAHHLVPSSPLPLTRLEKMFCLSVAGAVSESGVNPGDPRTIMIFSTTKGNIDQLAGKTGTQSDNPRLLLWEMAGFIGRLFNCAHVPYVVSNACTSGSVAIITAARLIASGKFDHAVITGGDVITGFVISGFQSFQALSPTICRPFDASRDGLSLGEGCGTLVLTCDPALTGKKRPVCFLGGATSNDANHISGPSRDGEGLYLAIAAAMGEAGVTPGDIGYISAHGTATPYNDEMESLALHWAGLGQAPVNSFKGYIGHTLGAAGIIETIFSTWSMRHDILFKSAGYETNGVTKPLNVISENIPTAVKSVLKTASGFGGCNAALVIGNEE